MSVIIDYLGHSGFFAETGSALMLFDYYTGDISFIRDRSPEKPLFVFVSHAHHDHFNNEIFRLADVRGDVRYLLSFDIEGSGEVPDGVDVSYLKADETYEVGGLGTVTTLLSTDEGVAFLVKTPEKTLFHAGDLHWWDWPGEDPAWLAEQEEVFAREIGKLKGVPIDIAFAVLDDRLEYNFHKGLELLISVCRPKYVLPMHYRKDAGVIERFRELPCMKDTDTVLLDTAAEKHWEL